VLIPQAQRHHHKARRPDEVASMASSMAPRTRVQLEIGQVSEVPASTSQPVSASEQQQAPQTDQHVARSSVDASQS
jgi:hypothetical protein